MSLCASTLGLVDLCRMLKFLSVLAFMGQFWQKSRLFPSPACGSIGWRDWSRAARNKLGRSLSVLPKKFIEVAVFGLPLINPAKSSILFSVLRNAHPDWRHLGFRTRIISA